MQNGFIRKSPSLLAILGGKVYAAAQSGYDFLEISIDETDEKCAAAMDAGQRKPSRDAIDKTCVLS
jgi:L-ribulose-5-phosphate 3-epimerase UlaE